MWPPHTNSRAPERERRLRVWLAASMIAMVDDPPGDVDGAVRPVQPNKASSTDERQPDLRAIVAATMAELSQGPKTFGPIDLGAPRILQA